jgi:glycosyltransferase involved in cell wall biosynthesis
MIKVMEGIEGVRCDAESDRTSPIMAEGGEEATREVVGVGVVESAAASSRSRRGGDALNVLFLTRSLSLGGAERQLVTLAGGLARRGHVVRVAVFYAGGPLSVELDRERIPILDLAKAGRWDLVGFARRLARCVRQVGPDVIHGYLTAPNLAASVVRTVSPRSRVVWGVRASDMDLSRYDGFEEWTFQLTRPLARTADRIVVNSNAGRKFHVARGYPADRTVVIPNGIDTARFRPLPAERAAARAELGSGDDEILIGTIARLDPMKDHDTFLSAAAILAARRPDVRFVAAGSGPVEDWRRRARERGLGGRVTFSGPRADIERVYAALDLATSTSAFGEGFPNAVAEAMACGVACVVTDVGDSASIVEGLGAVVRPGDPVALADAWATMLRPGAAPSAARLRSSIESRFSIDALVARTERALGDVVGGGG